MSHFFQKMILYAKLPEMRLFWFFLPFLIALLAINVFYLSGLWLLTAVGILLVLGMIILVNNLRLARSNLEIKIERNELMSIVSNLSDGLVSYDPNFRILIFNRTAEQIFGFPAKDVLGQKFSPERAQEKEFKILGQVIFPSLAPLVIRKSDPGVYPQVVDISFTEPKMELRVSTDRIADSGGRLLGFVKLIQDRTRESELLRSKTEFIAVASHQLRTPLSGIHWALESLVKEELKPDQKELVSTAFAASTKLSKIVNDLLDVSKIEEGKFGYQFENADIVGFVEQIVKETEDFAKQSGIKIQFQKPAEPINVSIDRNKLSMVVVNLLDNAVRYNVENGEVVVSVERVENQPYVRISVKDTGIGVPSEDIDKLFKKFFRADNAAKFYTEGSGLGLYIIKNIINRHGGKIWVESEINRGSVFYFTLPTDPTLIPSKEIAYGEE